MYQLRSALAARFVWASNPLAESRSRVAMEAFSRFGESTLIDVLVTRPEKLSHKNVVWIDDKCIEISESSRGGEAPSQPVGESVTGNG